jgi:prepilin peptidase CpaA
MGVSDLIMYIPLIAALLWAAVEDVHARRIRNALSVPLLVTGLFQSFLPHHTVGPLQSLAGFAAGFALVLIPFILGGMGGGDVKLLAAIGAWVGAWAVLNVFLIAGLFGLVVVLGQATYQGRLRVLARNSAVLAVNLAHVSELGVDHVAEQGNKSTSVNKPIPYAVSMLVGVIAVLAGLGVSL